MIENRGVISASMLLHTQDPYYGEDDVFTLVIKSPKYLDAEIEKHGNLASNSSSSRANPYPETKGEMGYFIPSHHHVYAKERAMFGKQLVDDELYDRLVNVLEGLHDHIIDELAPFKDIVHKQTLNRYLTAFAMQYKVLTMTRLAWENFYGLRSATDADPAIRELAECMNAAIGASEPAQRCAHIPMVEDIDIGGTYTLLERCRISAGRIANISYSHVNSMEPETAMHLAERLIENGHKTPFEHQLLPFANFPETITHKDMDGHFYSGRIRGWGQFRKWLFEEALC